MKSTKTATYTNTDLSLYCHNWEAFGGYEFSANHAVIVNANGNMRLVNSFDGSDFDAKGAAADYLMSLGADTTKRECVQFVRDYVDAWMNAAQDEYAAELARRLSVEVV